MECRKYEDDLDKFFNVDPSRVLVLETVPGQNKSHASIILKLLVSNSYQLFIYLFILINRKELLYMEMHFGEHTVLILF